MKKSLAKAIGSRAVKKSYVASSSSSNDTDDGMLEECLSQKIRKMNHWLMLSSQQGDYVLVKFAKKQHMSYDAGRVVRIDKREDEMQTTYTKGNNMRKSRTWHGMTSKTSFGDTTHTTDKLSFEFDFALYEIMLF